MRLVNAGSGYWDGSGLGSGIPGVDGKPVGSRQRLRTIPLVMEKEPYGNGGEEEIAIG